MFAHVPAAISLLIAGKPFQSGANGALGGIRSSQLFDGFRRWSPTALGHELGDSPGIEIVLGGCQLFRDERIIGLIISGKVEQVGNRVAGTIELGRSAEGLEAAMSIHGFAASVGSLRRCICLRDILYLGFVVDRGVGDSALSGLLGLHLIERFGRLEFCVRGVGGLFGKLLVGDLLLLKSWVLRFGQEGLGQSG